VAEFYTGSMTADMQSWHTTGNGTCQANVSDASQNFHTYELDWTAGSIVWKVDGTTTCTLTHDLPSSPLFVIIDSALLHQKLPEQPVTSVDYVRVTAAGPSATTLPSISGTPTHGNTLTANAGTWTGSPTGYTYQWERCNSSGLYCSPISGATSSTYTPTTSDEGQTIQVLVDATNSLGTTQYGSQPTSVIN